MEDRYERFDNLLESDQNDPEVLFQIGLCYLNGDGTDKDEKIAEEYIRSAAELGHNEAMVILRRDEPTETTEEKREEEVNAHNLPEWCERAEDGDVQAQYLVAEYWLNRADYDATADAQRYLNMAAEQGNPSACLMLAKIELNGNHPERAIALLKNAADCGPEAKALLAQCYSEGIGVDVDLEQAEKWFDSAALHKDGQYKLHLAFRYNFGYGVNRNIGKAFSYVKKAQDDGIYNAKELFDEKCKCELQRIAQLEEERIREEERIEAERLESIRIAEEARRAEETRIAEEKRIAEYNRANEQRSSTSERSRFWDVFQNIVEAIISFPYRFKQAAHKPIKVIAIALVLLLAVICIIASTVNKIEKGIDEIQLVTVDPFEDLIILCDGVAPYGSIELINNSPYYSLQVADYQVSKASGLINGEKITIKVKYNNALAKEDGIKLKTNSMVYEVSGLWSYATEASQISDKLVAEMEQQALDIVQAQIANYIWYSLAGDLDLYYDGRWVGANWHYDGDEITQHTTYFLSVKQGYEDTDRNRYIVVFKMPYYYEEDDEVIWDDYIYLAVVYNDVMYNEYGESSVVLSNRSGVTPELTVDDMYEMRVMRYKDKYYVHEILYEEPEQNIE